MAIGKSELFALVAGVLGFIVDIIALATFVVQVSPAHAAQRDAAFPRVWSILLLVYGWFVVSWILAQWKLKRRAREQSFSSRRREAHDDIAGIVVVVGLLLLPVAMMIAYDFLWGASKASSMDLEKLASLIACSLALLSLIGLAIFGATYGMLAIVNDEDELGL